MRAAKSRWFRIGVLLVFLVQAVFLVFFTRVDAPPDEQNHIEFIEFYANHSISPIFHEQAPTWNLGDKTRELDYFYHYVMSFVARVVPGEKADVYVIRLITVVTVLATLGVLIRIFQRLRIGDGAINVVLLIMTNIPMVLMLSSAVNNDALVWFGTCAGVLLLLRFWRSAQWIDALLLLNIIAVGGLVKRTLLPVLAVFAILLVFLVIRKWSQFRSTIQWRDWRVIVLLVTLAIGSMLFIERAGGNLIEYHSMTPSCEAVQGDTACRVFWANERKVWLESVQHDPAVEPNMWLQNAKKDETPMSILEFAGRWFYDSIVNVVDIQTNQWAHTVIPVYWLTPGLVSVLLIGLCLGIWYEIRHRKADRTSRYQRGMVASIAAVVMLIQLAVNYASYQHEKIFGLALNGRYILPSLLLLAGLVAFYYSQLLPRRLQVCLALILVVSVIAGSGLLMMVRNPGLYS